MPYLFVPKGPPFSICPFIDVPTAAINVEIKASDKPYRLTSGLSQHETMIPNTNTLVVMYECHG